MNKAKTMPGGPRPISRLLVLATAGMVLLVALAVYAPSLNHPFLSLDDDKYVSANPLMLDPSIPNAVRTAFQGQDYCYWHPLTVLSLYMDSRLFGLQPAGFHSVNLLLHAANAVLLLLLFWRMTGRLWPSALMAALFAAHPTHVESVAWITERKDVLSTFFFLLTLLAYHRYALSRTLARFALVAAGLALGLMAKPMLVSLPAVLLLMDYWPLARLWPDAGALPGPSPGSPSSATPSLAGLLLEKLPLLALALGSVAISFATLVPEEGAKAFSLVLGLKTAAVAYVQYLKMLFWPFGLGVLHPFPAEVPVWKWAGSLAALGGLTWAAVWYGRSRRYLLVGWLWFLGTMIPALKLYGGGLLYETASRFTYLPFIGIYLILAFGAEELARRGQASCRTVVGVGLCLVLGLGLAARHQLGFWKDSPTLFSHTLEVTGENPYMHYLLGLEMERKGDRAGALTEYRLCLDQDPEYIPAWLNVGNLLLERGRVDEASREYSRILEFAPEHYFALANLGVAAFLDGRMAEAEALTRRAMAKDPAKALAYVNLGKMRRSQGDYSAARDLFRQALERDPAQAQARRALEELGG